MLLDLKFQDCSIPSQYLGIKMLQNNFFLCALKGTSYHHLNGLRLFFQFDKLIFFIVCEFRSAFPHSCVDVFDDQYFPPLKLKKTFFYLFFNDIKLIKSKIYKIPQYFWLDLSAVLYYAVYNGLKNCIYVKCKLRFCFSYSYMNNLTVFDFQVQG